MSRVPASGAQPGSLVKGKPPTPIQYSTPSRMRNGVWERDTPIALTVFSQSENKKDTGIEQVKSRLKTLKQEDGRLSVSELEITPVTFNEKGHVRTVRVSCRWSENQVPGYQDIRVREGRPSWP